MVADRVTIRVEFEMGPDLEMIEAGLDVTYRDALIFDTVDEYNAVRLGPIAGMKQARFDAWKAVLLAPAPEPAEDTTPVDEASALDDALARLDESLAAARAARDAYAAARE